MNSIKGSNDKFFRTYNNQAVILEKKADDVVIFRFGVVKNHGLLDL